MSKQGEGHGPGMLWGEGPAVSQLEGEASALIQFSVPSAVASSWGMGTGTPGASFPQVTCLPTALAHMPQEAVRCPPESYHQNPWKSTVSSPVKVRYRPGPGRRGREARKFQGWVAKYSRHPTQKGGRKEVRGLGSFPGRAPGSVWKAAGGPGSL